MAETRYQRIWRNYVILKQQMWVMRTGSARMGIYPSTPDGRMEPQRPESVAEHVFGVLALFDEIAMFCPELISEGDVLLGLRTLMRHDAGENEVGDIPDDGRRDEARKAENEHRAMIRYCEKLPARYGMSMLRSFAEFQDKSSKMGQLLYCVDKGETVLQCALYERDGRDGADLSEELLEKLSEQDRRYRQMTGSKKVLDNWGAHYLDLIRDFECAPVFVEILRAAVMDVRGEWFPWYKEK